MTEVSWIAAIVVPVGVFLVGCIVVAVVYCYKRRRLADEEKAEYHINEVKNPDNSHHPTSYQKYPTSQYHHKSSGSRHHRHQRVSKNSRRSHNSENSPKNNHSRPRRTHRASQQVPKSSTRTVKGYGEEINNSSNNYNVNGQSPQRSLMRSQILGSTSGNQELKWYNRLGLFNSRDDDESLSYEGSEDLNAEHPRSPVSSHNSNDSNNYIYTTHINPENSVKNHETNINPWKTTLNIISKEPPRPNYFAVPLTHTSATTSFKEPSTIRPSVVATGTRLVPPINSPSDSMPHLSVRLSTTSEIFRQLDDELNMSSVYENTTLAKLQKYPSLRKPGNHEKSYQSSRIIQPFPLSDGLSKRSSTDTAGNGSGGASVLENFAYSSSPVKNSHDVNRHQNRDLERYNQAELPAAKIYRRRSSLSHRSIKSLKSTASSRRIKPGEGLSQSYLAINKPLPEDPVSNKSSPYRAKSPNNDGDLTVIHHELVDKADTQSVCTVTPSNSQPDIEALRDSPQNQFEAPITPPNRSPLRNPSYSSEKSLNMVIPSTPTPLRIEKNSNSNDSSNVNNENRSSNIGAVESDCTGAQSQHSKKKSIHLYEMSPFHEIDSSPNTGSLKTAHTSPSSTSPITAKGKIVNNINSDNPSKSGDTPSETSEIATKQLPEGIVAILGEVYRVVHPYKPELDDELEIKRGEKLLVFQVFDDGWCFARLLLGDPEKFPSDRPIEGICPKACLASL